jgi:hypothetical protein
MLVAQAVVFALSWLPLYSVRLRIMLGPGLAGVEKSIIRIVNPIFQWIGSANSCINPFIYCYFSQQFRAGIVAVLRRAASGVLRSCGFGVCCCKKCAAALQESSSGSTVPMRNGIDESEKKTYSTQWIKRQSENGDGGVRMSFERIDHV